MLPLVLATAVIACESALAPDLSSRIVPEPAEFPDPGASPAPSSACSAVLDSSLLSCWSFDAPNRFDDQSIYTHPVVATDVDVVTGMHGSAASFGATSTFRMNDAPALRPKDELTIEMWVKPYVPPAASTSLILLDKSGSWVLILRDDLGIDCTLSGSAPNVIVTSPAMEVGVWKHVACTFDGTTTRVYVDGTQSGTASTTAVLDTSYDPVRVGEDSPNGGQQFLGELDEVRLWNRALTAAEICDSAEPNCIN